MGQTSSSLLCSSPAQPAHANDPRLQATQAKAAKPPPSPLDRVRGHLPESSPDQDRVFVADPVTVPEKASPLRFLDPGGLASKSRLTPPERCSGAAGGAERVGLEGLHHQRIWPKHAKRLGASCGVSGLSSWMFRKTEHGGDRVD